LFLLSKSYKYNNLILNSVKFSIKKKNSFLNYSIISTSSTTFLNLYILNKFDILNKSKFIIANMYKINLIKG